MKNKITILVYKESNNSIMGTWPKWHFYDELRHHNCEIIDFCVDDYLTVEDANKALVNCGKNNHIDLFMTSFNEENLFINSLAQIKSFGIKTLLFCPDNLVIPYYHKNISPYFDLVWLTAIETKEYFDKLGANVIFMPYAANPFLKYSIKEETNGVCFIGTPYGSRVNAFNNLTNNGIDVYCTYKTNTANTLDKKKTKRKKDNMLNTLVHYIRLKQGRKIIISSIINRFFYKSKLNINNNLHLINTLDADELLNEYSKYSLCFSSTTSAHTGILKNPVYVCNLRSFEIPMAGGVLFARYNRELDSYFNNSIEAIYYYNDKDMIEKAKFYLDENNRKQLNEIKKNARIKAEKEHTWWVRFKTIFDKLSIEYIDK